jgi:hypothetical protein
MDSFWPSGAMTGSIKVRAQMTRACIDLETIDAVFDEIVPVEVVFFRRNVKDLVGISPLESPGTVYD